jgi:PTH1 family peptidyl-tRNA hydrolase
MRLFHRRTPPAEPAPTGAGAAAAPAPPIILVVGLGNPGREYAETRHNVGFRVVNRLGRRLGIEPRTHSRLVWLGEGERGGRPLVLAKPRTYMNRSGEAVRALVRRYRLAPAQVLVVYDDLDLPVGRIRVRARGGSGGTGGLKSIIAALGTQDFPRVRVGIGRPVQGGAPSWDPAVVAAYVLAVPPPEERALLDTAADRAVEAVLCILDKGIEPAMNRFNRE